MSWDYQYVIEQPVAEYIVTLPRSRARQSIAFFAHLAKNPSLAGQEWCADDTGRRHEGLLFGSVTWFFGPITRCVKFGLLKSLKTDF